MLVPLTIVWRFPAPMRGQGNKLISMVKDQTFALPGMKSFLNYRLDQPFEVIPGIWQVQIYTGRSFCTSDHSYCNCCFNLNDLGSTQSCALRRCTDAWQYALS